MRPYFGPGDDEQRAGPNDGFDRGCSGAGELARALRRLAEGSSVDDVLRLIADATCVAAGADVVVVRVLEEGGNLLEARAVSASSTSIAAELHGSRTAACWTRGIALGRASGRAHVALEPPIAFGERELGRLELFRRAQSFTAAEEAIGRLAAEHAAVALVGTGGNGKGAEAFTAGDLLRLGGDALASGLDEERTAEEIARLAVQGTGARSATVWRLDDDLQPHVAGTFGPEEPDERGVVDALGARTTFSIASGSWVWNSASRSSACCSSGSSSP